MRSESPTETISHGSVESLRLRIDNWLDDEVSILWSVLLVIPVSLDVAWEVSVSGVVKVLGWEEIVWLVEFVQLLVGVINVVFNTIAIFVINLLSEGASGIFPLLIMKVLSLESCLLYTSPSPRDQRGSRMPSSA